MADDTHVALTRCFFCGGDGTIVLATRIGKDVKTPFHDKVMDMNPCSRCAEHMKIGVILISIRDGEIDKGQQESKRDPKQIPNPYRTGRMCVIHDAAARRMLPAGHLALTVRWCFVEDGSWEKMGLPTASADYTLPGSLQADGPWASCKVCGTWRQLNSAWNDSRQRDEVQARCLVCHPNDGEQDFTLVPHTLQRYSDGPPGIEKKIYEDKNKEPDSASPDESASHH